MLEPEDRMYKGSCVQVHVGILPLMGACLDVRVPAAGIVLHELFQHHQCRVDPAHLLTLKGEILALGALPETNGSSQARK